MIKLEYLLFKRRQRSLEGIMINGVCVRPAYQLHTLKELYESGEDVNIYAKAEILSLKNMELKRKLTE